MSKRKEQNRTESTFGGNWTIDLKAVSWAGLYGTPGLP